MRKIVMATVIMAVTLGSAVAQTKSSSSSSANQGVWPAPTGHRQPRLDQVPDASGNTNDPVKREDAELDRKLKSICRGC
jgi:hypothetical protein